MRPWVPSVALQKVNNFKAPTREIIHRNKAQHTGHLVRAVEAGRQEGRVLLLKESIATNSATWNSGSINNVYKIWRQNEAFSDRRMYHRLTSPWEMLKEALGSREQYRVGMWICLGNPEFWKW